MRAAIFARVVAALPELRFLESLAPPSPRSTDATLQGRPLRQPAAGTGAHRPRRRARQRDLRHAGIQRVMAEIDAGALRLERRPAHARPGHQPARLREGRARRRPQPQPQPRPDATTPQDFEDHVANWLCPLLAEHEVLLDLHSFKRARRALRVHRARATTTARSSRSRTPRARRRMARASASAASSTAGSRPTRRVSRAGGRWPHRCPKRSSTSTRATASARPSTCARSAAAR